MNYSEQLKEDFARIFPEGGVRDVVAKALVELEEYGDLHGPNCAVLWEEECTCDMGGMKPFVAEQMQKVNNWWIKMTQEHRKYCSPEGRKVLTRLQGKKNRPPTYPV